MRVGLPIAAIILILDQLSKWWIIEKVMRPDGVIETPFYSPHSVEIFPVLHLVMAWNRGVSFGMFNNDGTWNALILSVLALVISACLIVWMRRADGLWMKISLGLVVGGALGNVIDRIRFGAVADFVFFHVGSFEWPAFNLADSAISVGAILLLAQSLFGAQVSHKNTP